MREKRETDRMREKLEEKFMRHLRNLRNEKIERLCDCDFLIMWLYFMI